MKHLFLAFFLTLSALSAEARCIGLDYRTQLDAEQKQRLVTQAQKTPFAYGNHWIATKGARKIHVIGTMHGGDSRMARVMRTLRPVLAKADTILLEVTSNEMGDPKTLLTDNARHFVLPKGRSLKQLASKDTWETLSRLAIVRGLNPDKIQNLQPWAASMFLIEDGCRPVGFGIRFGLDDRIERFAKRKRIPIGSLETTGESFSAQSRVSLRDQMRSLEFDLQMMQADRPADATPVEAYFKQEIWEAMIMHRWTQHQYIKAPKREIDRHWSRFEDNLLTLRNRNWMGRIVGTDVQNLVVAVGAAHLPGRYGVLNLLKNKGYKLERGPW